MSDSLYPVTQDCSNALILCVRMSFEVCVYCQAVVRSFFKGGGRKVEISRNQGGEGLAGVQNLLSDLGWPFQGGGA